MRRKDKLGNTRRIVSALLFVVLLAGSAAAQDRRRILVTNDDGIEASGLAALVAALSERFDVVVAAPLEDHSWGGQSKSIPSGMLRLRETEIEGAQAAWAIEGTPVDAINFALSALAEDAPFDAVVAGINRGSTLGHEATSTGVVGAAVEAAAHGLPAIAVAQDRRAHVFDVAAGVTASLLDAWLAKGLPEGTLLSVNVPSSAADKPRGIVVARLGQPEYAVGDFHKVPRDDERQLWRIQFSKVRRPERETDLDWYQRGEIVVTPLRWNGTATDLVPTVDGWGVEPPERP
jgi:5'-nucleotidase